MMLRRSPYFYAYLEGIEADFRTGCYKFRSLIQTLNSFSSDTAGWRVYRSVEEGKNAGGLDPATQMDEVMAFYKANGLGIEDGQSVLSIGAAVFREHFSNKNINFMWNRRDGHDELTLKLDDMRHVAPVTLERYIALADILIQWQRPRYMWVGDPNYWHNKHAMFDNVRTLANWFAWVPQAVTPAQIPSAYRVQAHLGGR